MSTPSGVAADMRWASAFSSLPESRRAAEEAAAALAATLGDAPLDLAIVFLGAHHVGQAAGVADALKQRLAPACLIGASAHGVATQAINSVVKRTAEASRLSGDVWVVTAERCHGEVGAATDR